MNERRRSAEHQRSNAALQEADARLLRANERLEFMDHAGKILGESLDYEKTLAQIVELMVSRIADWCLIDLVQDREIHRVAARTKDPTKQPLVERLGKEYPLYWGSPQPTARVLETSQPLFMERMSDELLRSLTRGPEHFALIRALGTRSSMVLPLGARGRIFGVVSISHGDEAHPYTEEDFHLGLDLAQRAATAIDRALLHRDTQNALRLREELIAVAAHELNTPVTVLQSSLQQLRRKGPDGPPADRTLRLIERQVRRLGRLIAELLMSVDINEARLAPKLQRMDLAAATREVTDQFHDEAATAGSQIHVVASGPVIAATDPRYLQLMLGSLLSNAMKFGQGAPVEVEVKEEGDTALVTVVDHGIGIPASVLPNLFERFSRGVSTRHYGGFGLGLYLVHRLIRALGGVVRVESTEGQGSAFTIALPKV
jgi:signal transduction histidine kinase